MIAAIGLIVGSLLSLFIPADSIRINGNASAKIIVDTGTSIDKIVKIDESDFDAKILGVNLKWILRDNGITDGERIFTLDAAVDELQANHIKYSIAAVCFLGAVYCAMFFVILCFAHKFAKSLEECNSPFEENVIKCMKNFGISLIPWVIFTFVTSGSLILALIVLVIFLLMSIFKYGAQLQQEADETL